MQSLVSIPLFKNILIEAAAIVRNIVRDGVTQSYKSDGTLITKADVAVNAFLRETLIAVFPDAAWLSEETTDNLRRLKMDWVWVVDPLDGTKEFVQDIPEYCVSVGLARNGRAIGGGIINPATGEGGAGFVGSEVEFWGGLDRSEPARELSIARICVSRSEMLVGDIVPFADIAAEMYPVGSVAYKLLRVAAGRDDLTFSVQPKSEWDICGGVALLNASGKHYRRFDGQQLRFNSPDTRIRSGGVAGPSWLVDQFMQQIAKRCSLT